MQGYGCGTEWRKAAGLALWGAIGFELRRKLQKPSHLGRSWSMRQNMDRFRRAVYRSLVSLSDTLPSVVLKPCTVHVEPIVLFEAVAFDSRDACLHLWNRRFFSSGGVFFLSFFFSFELFFFLSSCLFFFLAVFFLFSELFFVNVAARHGASNYPVNRQRGIETLQNLTCTIATWLGAALIST